MREVEYYPTIINELSRYNCRTYIYGKIHGEKGFYSVGHRKHFDLLIFNNVGNEKYIPNPLALEVKVNNGAYGKSEGALGDITRGLYDQITGVYRDKVFKCEKENWEGIPKYAFTTINAFEGKPLYASHYPDSSTFYLERFAWRMGVRVLRKIGEKHYLTFNGQASCFDGSWIGWERFDTLWREEEKQRKWY